MSRAEAAIPASDQELVRRAKAHSTAFARLWEGDTSEFSSPEEALYPASTILAWEQRGYRDARQIERLIAQLPTFEESSDVEVSEAVEQGLGTVEAIYDPEPTTDLDRLFRKLAPLSPTDRRREIRKRGYHWPSTDEVRARLQDAVFGAMADEQETVFVAPTASGKTQLVVTTPWLDRRELTGNEPVILLVGTKPARDEAIDRAEEQGLDVEVLLGHEDACPVAGGEYDPGNVAEDEESFWIDGWIPSEYFAYMAKRKGRSASEVHEEADRLVDGGLPCCDDGQCTLLAQWEAVPRDEDGNLVADLIIATDKFAHVPSIRENANIFHDEQPDYSLGFPQERIQRMVGAFLKEVEAPVDTWEEFVVVARSDILESDLAERMERALWDSPAWSEGWLYEDGVHTLTPVLTRALWRALTNGPDQNGRSTATLEYTRESRNRSLCDDALPNRKRLTVVINDDNIVRAIRDTPDFSQARSVIGLDAWPCRPLWERDVSLGIDIERTMTRYEQQLWRLFERGLEVVQVGDAARRLTRGERFSEQHARIIIDALLEKEPNRFSTAGTPKSINDRFKNLMRNSGIDDPELMYYGEQKSRNDFKSESVGLLYGCIDPGDGPILDFLAECGFDARPKYRGEDILCDKCGTKGGEGCNRCRCEDCDGAGCPECHETGGKRAHGRGFVGPDAEQATAFLESVSDCNNAQMVGRWGRAEDIENAVVYACTNALPDSLVDYRVEGVEWRYGRKQRAVVEQMNNLERATVQELTQIVLEADTGFAAEIDSIHLQTVRETLNRLTDYGKLIKEEHITSTGAHVYEVVAGESLPVHGIAKLGVPNSDV